MVSDEAPGVVGVVAAEVEFLEPPRIRILHPMMGVVYDAVVGVVPV